MKAKTERRQVERHFDKVAKRFDDIYVSKKFLDNFLNSIFRRGLKKRYELTKKFAEKNASGKTVLDIGCGSGQVSLLFALNGSKVTGIDFSPQMIEFSNKYAKDLKVEKKTNFIIDDFMEHTFKKTFDFSVVLGVTDYVKNVLPMIKKTMDQTDETALISFPRRFHFITPLRIIWLGAQGCPVHFYTKKQIQTLMSKAGVKNYKIITYASLFYLIARKK